MSVSAIVVTFNRLTLLKECIDQLLSINNDLNNIIVVNNNSNDGTFEYLENLQSERILVVNLDKNIGGAGGFSAGIKYAYENTDSDYFWLMDDDTMVKGDSLSLLLKAAKTLNGNFGFLNSYIRWWENMEPCNVPGDLPYNWNDKAQDGLIRLSNCTFVSVFIPRNVVKNIGLPKKEMFIWGDDLEYTHRIYEKYPDCYMVVDSEVIHKSAKTGIGERIYYEENLTRIKFNKFWYRNYIYIDRKYFSKYNLINDITHILLVLIRIPFKSKNRRLLRMKQVFLGLITGLLFNPKVEYPKEE